MTYMPVTSNARQELQVRLTAQRILSAHLRRSLTRGASFWAEIDLDLTEAHLHRFDLSFCRVQSANFDGATFTGTASFRLAVFTGTAFFHGATFTGNTEFDFATLNGGMFNRTKFAGDARFFGVRFVEDVFFGDPRFGDAATFAGDAVFDEARVAANSRLVVALPIGWTTRPVAEGEEEGWLYMVRDEDSSEQPTKAPGDGPA